MRDASLFAPPTMNAAADQRDQPWLDMDAGSHLPRRGRRLVGPVAASLALHVGALAAAVAWGPDELSLPSIAGQRNVISLTASMAVYSAPDAMDLPPVALPPLDAAIEVHPDHVLVGKRKFSFEPTQVELPPSAAPIELVSPPTISASASASRPALRHGTNAASPRGDAAPATAAIDQSVGHDDTLLPEGVANLKPDYPLAALRRGWSGEVLLQLTIGADGSVARVHVEQSSGHDVLDAAAVNAARQWRFRPALRWGKPVEYTMRQRVDFKLDRLAPL